MKNDKSGEYRINHAGKMREKWGIEAVKIRGLNLKVEICEFGTAKNPAAALRLSPQQ